MAQVVIRKCWSLFSEFLWVLQEVTATRMNPL